MRSDVTQGQSLGCRGVDLVMDDNLPAPAVLLADRSYDSDKVRKIMEARNVVLMIPMCQSHRLRVAVDRSLYRLRSVLSNGALTSLRMSAALQYATTKPQKATLDSLT